MHQKRYFLCHKEVFSEQYTGDRRRCTKCKDNDSAGSPAASTVPQRSSRRAQPLLNAAALA